MTMTMRAGTGRSATHRDVDGGGRVFSRSNVIFRETSLRFDDATGGDDDDAKSVSIPRGREDVPRRSSPSSKPPSRTCDGDAARANL